jgi:hypothetical protein
MKNALAIAVLFLLSGCVAPYSYKTLSANDPEIFLGDRLGSGAIGLNINIDDAHANRCSDFLNAGAFTSESTAISDKTKRIRTPAGKTIAISSIWFSGQRSCQPPVLMFSPENSGKYSVDMGFVPSKYLKTEKCFLSIVKITSDGKQEEIKDITVLPDCVK